MASLRLVDKTFQTNKPAPTMITALNQLVACLWALVHATTRSRNGSTCVTAPGCVTDCVAIWILSPLSPLLGVSASLLGGRAPGVTRTPGQRFRKPLLYPPELQGRKRRNVGELRVVQQGLDSTPLEP